MLAEFQSLFLRASVYGWLMLAGICLSVIFWWRLANRDSRLLVIYFGALGGAFFGAKVVYLLSEGWMHWQDQNRWIQLATGKTITGGLLGGYAGVEIAKSLLGYAGVTGDWFAAITPVTIMLGRVGCWFHGCCRGVACTETWYTVRDADGVCRWPSVPAEILFNFTAFATVIILRRQRLFAGQHFHLYLMGYGVFRFFHEFMREEPHLIGPITGYQLAAFAVAALGAAGFVRRQKEMARIGVSETLPEPPRKVFLTR